MSEPHQPEPEANRDSRPAVAPGTPRWVKISGVIVVVLLLLLVVSMLAGGNHGPARHVKSAPAGPDRHARAVSVTSPQSQDPGRFAW
jgi:hypothetical protein